MERAASLCSDSLFLSSTLRSPTWLLLLRLRMAGEGLAIGKIGSDPQLRIIRKKTIPESFIYSSKIPFIICVKLGDLSVACVRLREIFCDRPGARLSCALRRTFG